MSDCGADFSSGEREPSPAAFTNALLQLAQPFHGSLYGIEVRYPFPYNAGDGTVVPRDDDLLATFDALQQLAETGLRFKGADP